MPKLYHRAEWFDELSPTALSEQEFEELIVQNAAIIRTEATIVPFKKTVHSADASARADLALIADDYRQWSVVEVEMTRHDLYRHVLPQIRTLRQGIYSQEHAAYLHAKNPKFDLQKLGAMLRGNPPDVLVLVNKPDDEWLRELTRYGANMMVFEVFRSITNRHIFLIDGELPRAAAQVLSDLTFGLLPRCLLVGSPAALDFAVDARIPIFVNEQLTYWERFQTATAVYLTPIGSMPLQGGEKFALVQMDDGSYTILPLEQKGCPYDSKHKY